MKYGYEMSNKAFYDAWNAIGKPEKITDKNIMDSFFSKLMENTKGRFIVDHITNGNFDHVHSINFEEPYFKIQWKCYEKYREKYVSNELTDDELLEWSCFGCATYDYIVCNIRELVFFDLNGHLLISLLLNPIDTNAYEKDLKEKGYQVIYVDKDECFEKSFTFLEGGEKNFKRHICHLNSMPVFSILIQSKQCCTSCYDSMRILSYLMKNWVFDKLKEQHVKLNNSDNIDFESLSSIGNVCRKLYERYLKFFCVYTHIDNKLINSITNQYGYVKLGKLKKTINEYLPNEIEQSFVNSLNEFSHDSNVIPTVDSIEELLEKTINSISSLHTHLDDDIFKTWKSS